MNIPRQVVASATVEFKVTVTVQSGLTDDKSVQEIRAAVERTAENLVLGAIKNASVNRVVVGAIQVQTA